MKVSRRRRALSRGAARGVLEAQPTVHPPRTVGLSREKGGISPEFGHTGAARIGPALLERPKLRRVIRGNPTRRGDDPKIDIALGGPVGSRHRAESGRSVNALECWPLEHRRVGEKRSIGLGVALAIRTHQMRVEGVDAGVGAAPVVYRASTRSERHRCNDEESGH